MIIYSDLFELYELSILLAALGENYSKQIHLYPVDMTVDYYVLYIDPQEYSFVPIVRISLQTLPCCICNQIFVLIVYM